MSTHTVRILFFLIIALLATAVVYTIIIWKLRHRLRRRAHVAPPVTPGVYGFNGVELHACDTRADMPAVVRHGLAEAKVRAKRGVVLGVEETIAIYKLSPAQRDRLDTLPVEVLLIIIEDHLDYGSALALSRTNHFFDDLAPADWISENDKLDYVLAAEGFRQNLRRRRLACFLCLKLRGERRFERKARVKGMQRFGEKELGRRCRECYRRAGSPQPRFVEGRV